MEKTRRRNHQVMRMAGIFKLLLDLAGIERLRALIHYIKQDLGQEWSVREFWIGDRPLAGDFDVVFMVPHEKEEEVDVLGRVRYLRELFPQAFLVLFGRGKARLRRIREAAGGANVVVTYPLSAFYEEGTGIQRRKELARVLEG